MSLRATIAACLALAASAVAAAHPPTQSVAFVAVLPEGRLECTVVLDPVALLVGKPSDEVTDTEIDALLVRPPVQLDTSLRGLQVTLATEVRLRADGERLVPAVDSFPTLDDLRDWRAKHRGTPTPAAMSMRLHAALPAGARTLSMQLPVSLGSALFALDRPGLPRAVLPLDPGLESPGMDVSMVARPAAPAATPAPAPPQAAVPDTEPGAAATFARFVALGFHHIVPEGADHALFVLGLFLLTPRLRPLLLQVTAFTVAHSVTLTLAALGLVHVSPAIVEPAIALSIGFVAIENLFATRVTPWRLVVVFAFGLVHGLGFASGLAEIGLPADQLAGGIAGFSVGVEGGHVAVLAAAFLLLGWTRGNPWYRSRVEVPLSLGIAAIALWWTVQRLMTAG
jgi:hypothetical protein